MTWRATLFRQHLHHQILGRTRTQHLRSPSEALCAVFSFLKDSLVSCDSPPSENLTCRATSEQQRERKVLFVQFLQISVIHFILRWLSLSWRRTTIATMKVRPPLTHRLVNCSRSRIRSGFLSQFLFYFRLSALQLMNWRFVFPDLFVYCGFASAVCVLWGIWIGFEWITV